MTAPLLPLPSAQAASHLAIQSATAADAAECVQLRGQTRENAVSVARLREVGVTVESWGADIATGVLPGFVARDGSAMVGYCFGDVRNGEVVVLAVLPAWEGRGLGGALLQRVVLLLRAAGHAQLHLGCSADPSVRSYGFYRHLGWQGTGTLDRLGDELLVLPPGVGLAAVEG